MQAHYALGARACVLAPLCFRKTRLHGIVAVKSLLAASRPFRTLVLRYPAFPAPRCWEAWDSTYTAARTLCVQ